MVKVSAGSKKMSNRKRKVRIVVATACATIALVAFHLLTWGLTVETGVGFDYVLPDDYDFNRPDPPPEDRLFVPDHYYLESNTSIIRTWVVVNAIIRHRLPFDILMWRCDPTYLETHKNFTSFTIDEFSLIYADGSVSRLVTTNMPMANRTYEINPNGGTTQFDDAITKKQNFTVLLSGVSNRDTGQPVSFSVTNRYRCVSAFRIYPLAGSF